MRLLYSISHTMIQSVLTATFLIVWQIWIVQDIFVAMQSQMILTFFIGIFGFAFGVVFHQLTMALRVFMTSVATAIMVTLVLVVYPQFGYQFEWYILLGILLLSGILAHVLLYGSGARYGDDRHETI